MTKTNKSVQEIVDGVPCVNYGCNGQGTVCDSDGEPSQCEYCFKVRFPLRDEIATAIENARREERHRIEDVVSYATPFCIGVPQDPLISKGTVLSALSQHKEPISSNEKEV